MQIRAAQSDAIATFRKLHEDGSFVLPNPWDIGTAIYLQQAGFRALATTSAGFAFTRGRPDGGLSLDEMLAHIREMVAATPLPVNADFLGGFAGEPARLSENVGLCVATGVAGLSLEDSTGRAEVPLYAQDLAAERMRAARRAIDQSGIPVVLTGRCEAFLIDHPDPLPTVLTRLVAYAEAGADCLYAPGLTTSAEIQAVVKAVAPKPVNVLVTGFNARLSLAQLTDMGVRRISVGSGLGGGGGGDFSRATKKRPGRR
ncbi:MAG: isocitrate lyase/PEP mutase family protein, partial [Chthoniobacterales bacterium]